MLSHYNEAVLTKEIFFSLYDLYIIPQQPNTNYQESLFFLVLGCPVFDSGLPVSICREEAIYFIDALALFKNKVTNSSLLILPSPF